jgi:hypothetical protein
MFPRQTPVSCPQLDEHLEVLYVGLDATERIPTSSATSSRIGRVDSIRAVTRVRRSSKRWKVITSAWLDLRRISWNGFGWVLSGDGGVELSYLASYLDDPMCDTLS